MIRRHFTIGQVADEVGKSIKTLRRYEAAGLLPRARRDIRGRRVYTEEDVMTIRKLIYPDPPAGSGEKEGQHIAAD